MVRSVVVAALVALVIEGCSSTAPIYLPSSPPAEISAPAGYALEIKVLPRIGLFDELLYTCKSDYTARIRGEAIESTGILPAEWDAVIPRANTRSPRGTACENTYVGDLTRRNVRIEVLRDGKVPAGGCIWNLDTSKFASDKPVAGSCSYRGTLASNDAVAFKVSIDGTELVGEVPRDTLIVSMGDSYASGEGNPDGVLKLVENVPDPASVTWMSRRCHRSLWAGPIRAGMDLAARRLPEGAAVGTRGAYTILSAACSGAELRDMTTTGYPGRETLAQMSIVFGDTAHRNLPFWSRDPQYAVERRLTAQIDQIRDILAGYAKSGGRPQIDALVLSVGGNDINFGELVVGLVTRRNLLGNQDVAEGVRHDIRQLGNDFEVLANALDTRLSLNGGPPVDQILLTGYPDPTKATEASAPAETTYCDCRRNGFLGLGPIEQSFLCINSNENKAASESVITPLNAELKLVAEKLGWLFVPGIEGALVGHAWCLDARGASARYVRTFADSSALQGALPGTTGLSTGAMHPSANGHEKAYRDNIRAALQDERRIVKFKVVGEFVSLADGSLIVPPTATIGWEGSLLDPAATRIACEQAGNPAVCPLDYPQVWWAGRSNVNLCGGLDHGSCAFDAAKGTLSVNLAPYPADARELLVKARDGATKARLPAGSVGQLRVDARLPRIDSCRLVYPEGFRNCADGQAWLRATGGRLELVASVGESGFRAWRCEGTLAERCGPDSLLSIDKLPAGPSTLRAVAENQVGIRSNALNLVLRVDAEAPEISGITVSGHEFALGEPRVVLGKATRLATTYKAEDRDSGVRIPTRRGFDCISAVTSRKTHVLPVDQDGSFTIEAVDCAVPAGNSAKETIEVIRPMKAPPNSRILNVEQWRARLEAEPEERAQLLSRIARLAPRYGDPGTVADAHWPVFAAWLNILSGRRSPDGPGARFACGIEGRGPYRNTVFALVKAVEGCIAESATTPEARDKVISDLQRARLLGPSR
jgi:hypothetical protein